MVSSLRSSQLEVLVERREWHRVNVSLEETALVLSPLGDGFVDLGAPSMELTDALAPNIGTWNPNPEKRFVRIHKQENQGLGISIQGGAEGGRPIVISKIFPGMPADQTGALFVGDVILAVNGESLVNARHDEAVRALKQAGKMVNLQVQYRRDLHLRRENMLHRLSWEESRVGASSAGPTSNGQSAGEALRSFGLKLAFVTRNPLEEEDPENRTIEIRSHSARHILTLRCSSATEADAWFEAIHSCADTLLTQALAQVNLILGQSPQVLRMGWMAEQDAAIGWRAVFVALTVNDLLLYESVPAVKQEWANPSFTRPLIATRVVQTTARSFPVIMGLSDIISFSTRTGTQEGVRTHLFRLETHRELASWVKAIIQNTYVACEAIQQVSAPCVWNDQQCELSIQLDRGIKLSTTGDGQMLWQYPFEAIRATGDDGQQFLWMDFGEPIGEQEVDLLCSPKAVVFILHSFLATKVYQLGLYA
ncbi:hypothetical protein niasHT_009319 [Heterodera trifolii]|uniref:Syntrophin n=1 Tax=Heterodera trifolii TaxID=157864 RepID=A0ABD2LTN9_9BILA